MAPRREKTPLEECGSQLNNDLTIILSAAFDLLDATHPSDDWSREQLREVIGAAQRCAQNAQAVLQFSRRAKAKGCIL